MKAQILKICTDVKVGYKTPEQAQSELLDLFIVSKRFLFEWDVDSTIESMIIIANSKGEAHKEFVRLKPNTMASMEQL
jgi:hypothetical protein